MMIYLSLIDSEDDKNLFENVYRNNYEIMYHVALKLLNRPSEAENAVHRHFDWKTLLKEKENDK